MKKIDITLAEEKMMEAARHLVENNLYSDISGYDEENQTITLTVSYETTEREAVMELLELAEMEQE